jgi:hypothetical protein
MRAEDVETPLCPGLWGPSEGYAGRLLAEVSGEGATAGPEATMREVP